MSILSLQELEVNFQCAKSLRFEGLCSIAASITHLIYQNRQRARFAQQL